MALFGIDIDTLVIDDDPEFPVFKENWESLMLFISLSTQWRFAGMGGYSGLDYNAVKMVLDISPDIDDKYQCFIDIQILERAALSIFNKKE